MAIVRLGDNKQIEISLRYVSAKEKQNGAGLEYLYTLANGDVIFVPPMAHQEIQALKPAPGELFILAKRIEKGNAAVWSVERVPQAINETARPKPVARATEATPALTTPESQRLFKQLLATLEAVKAVEESSVTLGRPVKFESQDIRALAISSFIEQSRRAA